MRCSGLHMRKARKASCTSSRPQHRAAGSSNVTSSVHAAASSPPPADISSSPRRHAGGRAGRTHAQACCTTKHIPRYILATIFSCCAAREQDTHTGLAMASAAGALVVWARAGGEPTAACRTLLPRATIRESTALPQPGLVCKERDVRAGRYRTAQERQPGCRQPHVRHHDHAKTPRHEAQARPSH